MAEYTSLFHPTDWVSPRFPTQTITHKRKGSPGEPDDPRSIVCRACQRGRNETGTINPTGARSTNCDDPTHGPPPTATSDNETLDHLLSNVAGNQTMHASA